MPKGIKIGTSASLNIGTMPTFKDLSKNKSYIIPDINPLEGQRLLEQGTKTLGVSLSNFQINQFMDYLALLQKWNRAINLTGLRSCQEIIVKHFLDSLTPLPYLPEDARLMDLGTGAGFPGLPIQICRPNQSVTLIEASNKKCSFLKECRRHLNLRDTPVVQGYLGQESLPLPKPIQFDIITTRAVGKVIELLGGVVSYLPRGGQVMLMKGRQGLKEIEDLEVEIREKGFQIERPVFLTLPFLDQERILIFLTKFK
jgi:16S rRNA (guanine527-N7)-methyltransferase